MRVTADSVADIAERSRAIRQAVQAIKKSFQVNVHFMRWTQGRKSEQRDVLLLPGAQSLAAGFALQPHFEIESNDLPGGHREYETKCTLTDEDGKFVADGVGLCTSLENKYRYHNVWQNGRIVEKREVENPADCFNTVKKMSKKRAFVDAVINATACSDLFTQDLEDDVEPEAQPPARTPQDDERKQRAQQRAQERTQRAQEHDGPELDTSNAQQPAAEEQDEPGTLHITAVEELKSGESKRGPWTLWKISTIEKEEFVTFDSDVQAAAAQCVEQRLPARIEWKMERNSKTATKVSPRPAEGDKRPAWENGAITAVKLRTTQRDGSEVRWWEVATSLGDGYFVRHAGVAQRLSELAGTGESIGYLVQSMEKNGVVRAEITKLREDDDE